MNWSFYSANLGLFAVFYGTSYARLLYRPLHHAVLAGFRNVLESACPRPDLRRDPAVCKHFVVGSIHDSMGTVSFASRFIAELGQIQDAQEQEKAAKAQSDSSIQAHSTSTATAIRPQEGDGLIDRKAGISSK